MVSAAREPKIRREGSNATGIILRVSGGILQLCINIAFYIAVVMLIIKAAHYAYDFAYQVFGDVPYDATSTREVEVRISKGESSMNIAAKLEDNKLIVNKYSFYVKTKLKDYNIMPGVFVLSPSMTYDDILDIITDYSKSIVQEDLTDSKADTIP
ncbi:MAG: endolytic transglycosylase MltG [Lachnospiraceae bacterium]|nr:endolytic transglycosylase MltG [Lachnospiraceae bacterium]